MERFVFTHKVRIYYENNNDDGIDKKWCVTARKWREDCVDSLGNERAERTRSRAGAIVACNEVASHSQQQD